MISLHTSIKNQIFKLNASIAPPNDILEAFRGVLRPPEGVSEPSRSVLEGLGATLESSWSISEASWHPFESKTLFRPLPRLTFEGCLQRNHQLGRVRPGFSMERKERKIKFKELQAFFVLLFSFVSVLLCVCYWLSMCLSFPVSRKLINHGRDWPCSLLRRWQGNWEISK